MKQLPEGEITEYSPYLEVNVLITDPEPSMKFQIEEILRNKSVRLARIGSNTVSSQSKDTVFYRDLHSLNPITLAQEVYKKQYNTEMTDELTALLSQIIEEVQE